MSGSSPALSGPTAVGLGGLSIVLVALGVAAGALGGWATMLFIGLSLIDGAVIGVQVGHATPRGDASAVELEPEIPISGGPGEVVVPAALRGVSLRILAYLAAMIFAAVQAHATGAGLVSGAPAGSVALLVPPVAVAAFALVSAWRWTDR